MKRNGPVIIALVIAVLVWQFLKTPQASQTPALNVSVLDIGQGDAILLTTPHRHFIVIDGGPDGTVLTRMGEIMRFNEHTIDLAIVSHNHADHITGLNRVLARYDVKKIWFSGALHTTNEYTTMLKTIKDKRIPNEVVVAGKQVELDGVTLEVEHPLTDATGTRPDDQHDATVVVKACFSTCVLLTGDLNEGHEQAMLDAHEDLHAEVLKVPHHGSKTGLSPAFLAAVNPKLAIISVGATNTFGHPAPSILTRLKESNIPTFRTDQNGTVTCVLHATVECRGAR